MKRSHTFKVECQILLLIVHYTAKLVNVVLNVINPDFQAGVTVASIELIFQKDINQLTDLSS